LDRPSAAQRPEDSLAGRWKCSRASGYWDREVPPAACPSPPDIVTPRPAFVAAREWAHPLSKAGDDTIHGLGSLPQGQPGGSVRPSPWRWAVQASGRSISYVTGRKGLPQRYPPLSLPGWWHLLLAPLLFPLRHRCLQAAAAQGPSDMRSFTASHPHRVHMLFHTSVRVAR